MLPASLLSMVLFALAWQNRVHKKKVKTLWQIELIEKTKQNTTNMSTLRCEDNRLRLTSLCPSQENLQSRIVKAKLEA